MLIKPSQGMPGAVPTYSSAPDSSLPVPVSYPALSKLAIPPPRQVQAGNCKTHSLLSCVASRESSFHRRNRSYVEVERFVQLIAAARMQGRKPNRTLNSCHEVAWCAHDARDPCCLRRSQRGNTHKALQRYVAQRAVVLKYLENRMCVSRSTQEVSAKTEAKH